MTISRTYRFNDGNTLTNSHVEVEIGNIVDTLNNLNNGLVAWDNILLKAPDGAKFSLSIIYDSDGVTPLLQIEPA